LILLSACSPVENENESELVSRIHNNAKRIGIDVPQIVGLDIENTIEEILELSEFRGFQNPSIDLPIEVEELEVIANLSAQMVEELPERLGILDSISLNAFELGAGSGSDAFPAEGLTAMNESLVFSIKEEAIRNGYLFDNKDNSKLPITDLRKILEFTDFVVSEIPRAEFSELVLAITPRKTAIELAVLTRNVSDMNELDAGEYGIPENFGVNSQMHGANVEDGLVKMTWRLDGSPLSGVTYTLTPASLTPPIQWIEGGTCLDSGLC
jgi:type IV pilus assembly protein PilA